MSGVTKPQFVAILINLSYRDDNAYEFQNIICLLHPYTFTGDNECWAGTKPLVHSYFFSGYQKWEVVRRYETTIDEHWSQWNKLQCIAIAYQRYLTLEIT